MRRNARCLIPMLAVLLALFILAPAWAGPVVFRMAHFLSPIEPGAQVGQWIEEDLNENAKDLVQCKYYHSMQMGSTIEIVKKVRMGTLHAGFLTGNYAPDLNPKFGIGTLGYYMDSYDKWNAFRKNDALREELFNSLADKGLRIVDLCYFGVYGLSTTKPVGTLEDLRVMKMRTTQARYPLAFWKALGVNPVPMEWGDVFPALKQGVVDGTDHTMIVADLRLSEVCKYFTRTNHMIGLFFLVVNDKWYQGLSPEVRQVILASIARNFEKARQATMKMDDQGDASLRSKGVTVVELSREEMERFRNAQMSVWKEFEPEIGKDWLEKVTTLTSGM